MYNLAQRGDQMSRHPALLIVALWGVWCAHSAVSLRLKGIVPPTSE
jgi:hypothetical protein